MQGSSSKIFSSPTKNLGEVVTRTSSGEPLSFQYDDEWDFVGTQNVGIGKTTKVSFCAIKNPLQKKAIQDVMYDFYQSEKSKGKAPSVALMVALRGNLIRVISCLSSEDWSLLNNDSEYRLFKKQLKIKEYSKGTIEGLVSSLNKLNDLDKHSRAIDGNELYELAKDDLQKQHIALPIRIHQTILSHCIKTVERYHPLRHEISRVMDEAHAIQEQVKNGELKLNNCSTISMHPRDINRRTQRLCKAKIKHAIPNFKLVFNGSWLTGILVDCIMVVALFSGARIGEIFSFDKDSYVERDTISGNKISILKGQTTKGNGGVEKAEVWQTHPIAQEAIELASDMMQFARKRYRDALQRDFSNGKIIQDKYERAMKETSVAFVAPDLTVTNKSNYVLSLASISANNKSIFKRLGLSATPEDVEEFDLLNPTRSGQLIVGGFLPKLSPHDFRRSFAVFFKRYGFGNSLSIKFQYKHKNINMSDYYANNAELTAMNDVLLDKDLLTMFEEEGIQLGVDIFDEIYNKSEHLSGVEGESIQRDKFNRLKAGHKVYMSRSEIDGLVRNGSLSVVMLPTGGYCTNTNCDRLCGIEGFIAEKKFAPIKYSLTKRQKSRRNLEFD